mgnify:CR=1 FL=1
MKRSQDSPKGEDGNIVNEKSIEKAGESERVGQQSASSSSLFLSCMNDWRCWFYSFGPPSQKTVPAKKKSRTSPPGRGRQDSTARDDNQQAGRDGGRAQAEAEIPKRSTSSIPAAIVASSKVAYEGNVKGGARVRLPDKLYEYLSNDVSKDTLWWHDDHSFAFDTKKMDDFLDKYFDKTKLKSFIRSINRWCVKINYSVGRSSTVFIKFLRFALLS